MPTQPAARFPFLYHPPPPPRGAITVLPLCQPLQLALDLTVSLPTSFLITISSFSILTLPQYDLKFLYSALPRHDVKLMYPYFTSLRSQASVSLLFPVMISSFHIFALPRHDLKLLCPCLPSSRSQASLSLLCLITISSCCITAFLITVSSFCIVTCRHPDLEVLYHGFFSSQSQVSKSLLFPHYDHKLVYRCFSSPRSQASVSLLCPFTSSSFFILALHPTIPSFCIPAPPQSFPPSIPYELGILKVAAETNLFGHSRGSRTNDGHF